MLYKKSVVLGGVDGSLKKAVLNLEYKNASVGGEVKLYNFQEEPMGVLTLAILAGGKVHKAALTRVGYMEYRFAGILPEIPQTMSSAVVSSFGGEVSALLLGAVNESNKFENVLLENLSVLKETSVQKVEEVIEDALGEYEDEEEIQDVIDKEMEASCPHACWSCEYKKAFYDCKENIAERATINQSNSANELKEEIIRGKLRVPEQKDGITFIDEIGQQIKGLFDEYPAEEVLESIIPNSKWVSVDFNGDVKTYVVGLIMEAGDIKFIAYGVPGVWSETAPANFNPEAQFLPLDVSDPKGQGYWLTYQNAFDGELAIVDII